MGKTLVIYKSVTGFTENYAKAIAAALGGEAVSLKKVRGEELAACDRVIFGGRMFAGTVSGLKKVRGMLAGSKAELAVFAVGAMPDCEQTRETVRQMWEQNLGEDLDRIPHFYMQGGLRYDRMPLHERLMMKAFSSMLKKQENQSEFDREAAKVMGSSFDGSDEKFILPLVEALK